jgi:formate dehydrogenase iron-sulfur subunit
MVACPYGIPRYDWDKAVPLVRKCTLCYQRLKKDKDAVPACVEACPEKATIFGTRKEMLDEAHRRLAGPDVYHQRVYGEHEVGGTSVLYISDAPLNISDASLSLLPAEDDARRNQPLPALTGAALNKVPGIILGMGGMMFGIHWIIGRRMKMAQAQVKDEGRSTRDEDAGSK